MLGTIFLMSPVSMHGASTQKLRKERGLKDWEDTADGETHKLVEKLEIKGIRNYFGI